MAADVMPVVALCENPAVIDLSIALQKTPSRGGGLEPAQHLQQAAAKTLA
jgi:hypothetical protein